MESFIQPSKPALVLAPMEGVTDAPMRALLTARGGFDYCVTEFFRISQDLPLVQTIRNHVPELKNGARTPAGTPVQVQFLGGDPERLAQAALRACEAGAKAIDLNFGCPAPLVNKHDGGASLLKHPERIYAIVSAVRTALPKHIPLSAKLRLGWENPEDIFTNALQAEKGGAQWITIHARTKAQGYRPPAHWQFIGEVRKHLSVPVIANGDIWSLEDLIRCQEVTGCIHFMIGRSAMADPLLPLQIASFLKTGKAEHVSFTHSPGNWKPLLETFSELCAPGSRTSNYAACRIKQWLSMVAFRTPTDWIPEVRKAANLEAIFATLDRPPSCTSSHP